MSSRYVTNYATCPNSPRSVFLVKSEYTSEFCGKNKSGPLKISTLEIPYLASIMVSSTKTRDMYFIYVGLTKIL